MHPHNKQITLFRPFCHLRLAVLAVLASGDCYQATGEVKEIIILVFPTAVVHFAL